MVLRAPGPMARHSTLSTVLAQIMGADLVAALTVEAEAVAGMRAIFLVQTDDFDHALEAGARHIFFREGLGGAHPRDGFGPLADGGGPGGARVAGGWPMSSTG